MRHIVYGANNATKGSTSRKPFTIWEIIIRLGFSISKLNSICANDAHCIDTWNDILSSRMYD